MPAHSPLYACHLACTYQQGVVTESYLGASASEKLMAHGKVSDKPGEVFKLFDASGFAFQRRVSDNKGLLMQPSGIQA